MFAMLLSMFDGRKGTQPIVYIRIIPTFLHIRVGSSYHTHVYTLATVLGMYCILYTINCYAVYCVCIVFAYTYMNIRYRVFGENARVCI